MKRATTKLWAGMVAATALFWAGSGQAQAESIVIDFNSNPVGLFVSLTAGDFVFNYVGYGALPEVSNIGPGNNALLDSLDDYDYGAAVIMSRGDGGTFNVTQFDLLNLNGGPPLLLDYMGGVYYSSAGTYTRSDLVDITAVEIGVVDTSGFGGANFAVDNIHVTYENGGPDNGVPEPATWLLLGMGGFALFGAHRRLRK